MKTRKNYRGREIAKRNAAHSKEEYLFKDGTYNTATNYPCPPADYTRNPPILAKGEPKWDDIDNPSSFLDYYYTPKFKDGKYVYHCCPAGATMVRGR